MPKKSTDITAKRKLLNDLKVKLVIEKTEKYNEEIESIEKELNYFDFGVLK